MIYFKKFAATAVVVFGLASAATAAPLAPVAADTVAGTAHVTGVAFGCGPGFTRGRFGRCHPFYGPRRFYGRRFFHHRRFYGRRRFFHHHRFFGRHHFRGHHGFHRL